MISKRLPRLLCVLFLLVMSPFLYADDPPLALNFLPTDATHVSFAFSGVVQNEAGESLGYFFEMQRDENKFHAIAALLDGQNNRVVLLDESEEDVLDIKPYDWHVGRAFLQFNPINDSWIFGLRSQKNKGFNFKVDMLSPTESHPAAQDLTKDVVLLVSQTSRLNGHIKTGKDSKEEFVTAKNSWFRQVWFKKPQDKSCPFTGVLCRFNDGSGFYSVTMPDKNALRGAIAGYSNEQGVPLAMSQFIQVKQAKEGLWHIRVASPNLHLVLSDYIKQSSVVAGFLNKGKNPGFCMLSKNNLGSPPLVISPLAQLKGLEGKS